MNTPGSWYCECPPGFTDSWCMSHVNQCSPSPCLNQGTCLDFGTAFKCVCMSGKCVDYSYDEKFEFMSYNLIILSSLCGDLYESSALRCCLFSLMQQTGKCKLPSSNLYKMPCFTYIVFSIESITNLSSTKPMTLY